MKRYVYLFKGDKGLYTKDKGKYWFPSNTLFPDAKEGFACVEVCKDFEKFSIIKGEMVTNEGLDEKGCVSAFSEMCVSSCSVIRIGDCSVAYYSDGYTLSIYINGKIWSDWGYMELEMLKSFADSGLPIDSLYIRGYALCEKLESMERGYDLDMARSVSCWCFGRYDRLYCIGGRVLMFDPGDCRSNNKGYMVGDKWQGLGVADTICMWEYLCKRYPDDIKEVKF